jgi:hypothetical protein
LHVPKFHFILIVVTLVLQINIEFRHLLFHGHFQTRCVLQLVPEHLNFILKVLDQGRLTGRSRVEFNLRAEVNHVAVHCSLEHS